MQHVFKYDVYVCVLHLMSIYVIKYELLRESHLTYQDYRQIRTHGALSYMILSSPYRLPMFASMKFGNGYLDPTEFKSLMQDLQQRMDCQISWDHLIRLANREGLKRDTQGILLSVG